MRTLLIHLFRIFNPWKQISIEKFEIIEGCLGLKKFSSLALLSSISIKNNVPPPGKQNILKQIFYLLASFSFILLIYFHFLFHINLSWKEKHGVARIKNNFHIIFSNILYIKNKNVVHNYYKDETRKIPYFLLTKFSTEKSRQKTIFSRFLHVKKILSSYHH